jgi:octaprenyl-diphosphate synthase
VKNKQSWTYREVLAHFAADLAAIEESIFSNLDSRNELLQKISTYVARSGGKRLRPLLVCICAKLNGYEGRDHIALGNVVEYLHSATLLHDDVIDNATLRRGEASANKKWGNHFAVLGGDFLYTSAFDILLQRFPRDIIQVLCRSSLDMIEGEVLQRQWQGRIDLSEGTYFEIISLKTASLIAASCRSGALLGGASPEQVADLSDFGRLLGTAFQVIDDTLDYTADPAKLGKILGGDLRQGTVTLPLIYLLQEPSLGSGRVELMEALAREEIEEETVRQVISLLDKHQCGRRALEKAAALAGASKEKLRSLAGSPLHPALTAAADFIIERTH